jgi:hypothetical protein
MALIQFRYSFPDCHQVVLHAFVYLWLHVLSLQTWSNCWTMKTWPSKGMTGDAKTTSAESGNSSASTHQSGGESDVVDHVINV